MQESCADATIGCPCDATWEHKCTADYGFGGAIQTTGWKALLPKTHLSGLKTLHCCLEAIPGARASLTLALWIVATDLCAT